MPEDDNQQREVDTHRIGKDYLLQLTSSLWLEDVLFYIFDFVNTLVLLFLFKSSS